MGKKTFMIALGLTVILLALVFAFGAAAAAPGISKQAETTVTSSALSVNLGDYYLGNLSFQQDAIATCNGWQYVTFYSSSRQVTVARRHLPSGSWQLLSLTDYTQSTNDGHNIISLGISPSDGTIHLAFDHHDSPLHYRKSVTGLATNPGSYSWTASLFGSVTDQLGPGSPVSQLSYPRFVSTPQGNLQFTARIGGSGNGRNYLWEYQGSTGTWASLGMYIDNPSGGNAYLNGFHYDQNGRLHISWVKRESPDASTNHDLHYAYSDDNGRTWRNNNGSTIGATGSDPMTIEEPRVWTIPTNSGLINQEAQAIDHQGRIHVLLRKDASGTNYQFHYWRDAGGVWHETNTGFATKYWARRSKIAIDDNNNVYAIMPDLVIGSASASTGWTDWTVVNNADEGRFHSEPLYDWYRLYDGDGVLSVMYQLTNSGSLRVLDYTLGSIPSPTSTPVTVVSPTATPTSVPGGVCQAEDATLGGGVSVDTNHSGYYGTGFVNFPSSGGYVEYRNVDGETGGSRTLRFRHALGATGARTGQLTINGASQNITFSPTGSWDTWAIHEVVVNLNAGAGNTIRLQSTGQDLANQDQLEVVGGTTPVTVMPPTSTPVTVIPPTPTPTTVPPTTGPGGCAVSYTIQNDWGSGATVNVTIRNNGASAVNGWTLEWTFPGNQQIVHLWNGSYSQSGTLASVSNTSWNATIGANGGTAGFGFILTYSGSNAVPASFSLNGTPCQ